MTNKTVSFRIPAELVEAIEAQAQATGQSKTTVVIEALAKAYGCPHYLTQSSIPKQFQLQLNELEHQITILSEANKLLQLITAADTPIKLESEVEALISSMPLEDRLAWVNFVLTEAARKELGLQTSSGTNTNLK